MNEPCWCCGQMIQRLGMFAKWPGESPRIPWHVDVSGYIGTLTPAQILGAFQTAWGWWAEPADFTPVMVGSPGEALVRIHFARIDGPNGILAWSELANNTNQPKTQRYDNSEKWTIDWFLQAVAAHEIGHVLGLEHDGQNSGALMAPFIQQNVPKPTKRDIDRLIGLGYRRRTTPIPPAPPTLPIPDNGFRVAEYLPAGVHGKITLKDALPPGDYLAFPHQINPNHPPIPPSE